MLQTLLNVGHAQNTLSICIMQEHRITSKLFSHTKTVKVLYKSLIN